MRIKVYESVGHPSVCPIRLLRVCCCEPGGQKISMDSCTGVGSAVNTGSIARSSKCGHRRQRRRGCKGRDPQIFDLQTTTQYFDKCFIFFPSAELLNTASRCHFHLHHITPFWDEKFINFLGRGTASPQTQPLAAYGALILASSALDLRPPNVPVALTPLNAGSATFPADVYEAELTTLRLVMTLHCPPCCAGIQPMSQCLNGRAPPYLSEHRIPRGLQCWHAAASAFRRHLLVVPRFRLNTYGRSQLLLNTHGYTTKYRLNKTGSR